MRRARALCASRMSCGESQTRPASTLIGVKELALPGMKVEIDAVAGLKPKR